MRAHTAAVTVALAATLALVASDAQAAQGPADQSADASFWQELARPGLGRSRDLFRQAVVLLERGDGAFPGNWEPVCARSLALPLPGDPDASRRGRLRALAQLARGVLTRRAYLESALVRLDHALALDPSAAPLLYARGRALAAWEEPAPTWNCASRRRTAEAIDALQRLTRVDPTFHATEVAFDLALLFSHEGRFSDAARAYARVIALALDERDTPVARSNLAEMKMLAGQLEEAVGHYERALALAAEPRSGLLAHWGLAVALDRLGEHERALEHARKAVDGEGGAMRVLRSDGVFYEPAHEIQYYEALGHEALSARDGADRETELRAAADAWRAFVSGAGVGGTFTDTARRNAERVGTALAALTAAQAPAKTRARRSRAQRATTTAETLP